MSYPKATDYVAAVQDPGALLDAELARASFRMHPMLQVPFPASGNSAVVFQASIDGRPHALRFFIRDDASSRERYNTLRDFLHQHRMADCTAAAQWVDGAIRVNGQNWPMVKMEWIDGRALDAYVDSLVQDQNRAALLALASAWLQLVGRMQSVRFAHGDLQHGNVLVDTGRRLRLVDFDGCWTPASVGPKPTETGHPNYQLSGRPWGQWMDTFPGLLVYTALCGLAWEPELWKKYGARENILFTREDFVRPFETPVWSDLSSLGDAGITHGLTQLSAACGAASALTVPLEAMVADQKDQSRPVFTAGPLKPTPWWEKTGWTPAQTSPGAAGGASTRPSPGQPPPTRPSPTRPPPTQPFPAQPPPTQPPPTQPPPTNLPPPPPRSQPHVDPRFSAAHSGPWHGQSSRQGARGTGGRAAGAGAAGTGRPGGQGGASRPGSPGGPARGPGGPARPGGPGGPGRPGGPAGPGGPTGPGWAGGAGGGPPRTYSPVPPPQPPPPAKRSRTWLVVVVIAVILLVIVIGALINESSSSYSPPPDPSPTETSETVFPSPYPSEPSTIEPVQPTSEADLLLTHVPAPLSDSCTERQPPQNNPAVAVLSCSASGESISVDYYSYETAADLSDTYQRDYSTDGQGDCRNGEAGSGSYTSSAGDRLGDFSCYATDDYYVLTWTHEPAGILTVAYSETVTFPTLITWTDANAGPTT